MECSKLHNQFRLSLEFSGYSNDQYSLSGSCLQKLFNFDADSDKIGSESIGKVLLEEMTFTAIMILFN